MTKKTFSLTPEKTFILNFWLSSSPYSIKDQQITFLFVYYLQMAKSRIYLYEAVSRLMAGASPGQTQELLDRSLHEQCRRNARSTFHCGGSNQTTTSDNNSKADAKQTLNRRRFGQNATANGDRERATAMYVACKYLPKSLLCSPGERIGMLAEAAKTLKKFGDRKKLYDCYQLMQSIGGATTVSSKCN